MESARITVATLARACEVNVFFLNISFFRDAKAGMKESTCLFSAEFYDPTYLQFWPRHLAVSCKAVLSINIVASKSIT